MLELIGLEPGKPASKRLQMLLQKPDDCDLVDQTIGAEENEFLCTSSGEATGKTYEKLYGEQVAAVHLYMEQDDTFGFLSAEKMKQIVFFFRINLFGPCHLAAVCILASYLGQMASELKHVICPPDVGKLIRSFKDDDLYNYIVEDKGGDASKVLVDMLQVFGRKCYLTQFTCDFLPADVLKKAPKQNGPGLVTNFKCTKKFYDAYKNNPAWQCNEGNDGKATVGLIQFDMKSGQGFKSVQGKYVELKANRGHETLDGLVSKVVSEAKEKLQKQRNWYDPTSSNRSPSAVRGGDRSAHILSPESSTDYIQSSSLHDRIAIRQDQEDRLDHGDEAIEVLRGGDSREPRTRDRPPSR